MATLLFWTFALLFESVFSLYTDNSIVINVDVSIKTVSRLLQKANTNIQDIIQTSFEHTNRDPSYLILTIVDIIPISNFTYNCNDDSSFRYHAMLNIYFKSETEYIYAIRAYQDIFSHDLTNFIKLYEENIYNELLITLNTDSLSSQAVAINSLNMLQGVVIMNYIQASKTEIKTQLISTIYPQTTTLTAADMPHPTAFIKDNLILLIISGVIAILICFCCTMLCFWHGHQQQSKQRKRERQKTVSMENFEFKAEEHRNIHSENRERSDMDTQSSKSHIAKDPFEWNNDEVIDWLKQKELFIKYGSSINGKQLLTKHKQFDIETNDNNKLMKGIKRLRLESHSYHLWEMNINEYNEYASTISELQAEGYKNNGIETKKKKKIIRKPPKKLRRKASNKKREESVSISSTMEILGSATRNKRVYLNRSAKINNRNVESKGHKYDSSEETEESSDSDNDYYLSETAETHQLYL